MSDAKLKEVKKKDVEIDELRILYFQCFHVVQYPFCTLGIWYNGNIGGMQQHLKSELNIFGQYLNIINIR